MDPKTLDDVYAILSTISGQLNTLIFLVTAGAFTLGGLLGFACWFLVLRAMQEADF